ncbi:LysE family translocator [Saccharothrix deserti]|uniref:LysE family translocator n=1 Tax=Saccharothrix deserti TaxID=2593674 RepID=UPI00131E377C|nr:LysE family translocator [Saccharothrix deserti]
MTSVLLSYLGLCLLITITPGLDTAVVVRNALRGGTRAGLWTSVGCAAGLFVHAVVVAVGLANLLLRSRYAFDLVRLAGAVLLVLLGLRSLWAARRPVEPPPVEEGGAGRFGRRAPVVQGLMTNLTNPKATLFFLAALPQFVPVDQPGRAVPIAVGLAVIAVLFSLTGLGLVAVGLGRVRRWLDSPKARQVQEGLLGATLIALGVRVAVQ